MKTILGCVAGTMLFSIAAHAAPIVTNGSFENGFSGWNVSGFGTTPGNGPVVITTGGMNSTGYGDNVPNYDGTHAAYFVDDNAHQKISQSVTIARSYTTYTLSFGLFATASGAANPFSFTLTDSLGGTVLNTFKNSFNTTDVPVGVWTTETAQFYATAPGNYLLSFNFNSGFQPATDVLLDGVSIGAVPLPASAPMFGAALMALGAVGYGMKRKKAVAA